MPGPRPPPGGGEEPPIPGLHPPPGEEPPMPGPKPPTPGPKPPAPGPKPGPILNEDCLGVEKATYKWIIVFIKWLERVEKYIREHKMEEVPNENVETGVVKPLYSTFLVAFSRLYKGLRKCGDYKGMEIVREISFKISDHFWYLEGTKRSRGNLLPKTIHKHIAMLLNEVKPLAEDFNIHYEHLKKFMKKPIKAKFPKHIKIPSNCLDLVSFTDKWLGNFQTFLEEFLKKEEKFKVVSRFGLLTMLGHPLSVEYIPYLRD